MKRMIAALALTLGAGLAACGLDVRSADLFVLTRAGQGAKLTLLVSDGGTIRCNGAKAKRISDPLLIQARDLADDLDKDAKAKLKLPVRTASVYAYTVMLPDGTLNFADTNVKGHQELARAELFAAQAAQSACGLSG
ncbi:MAG: hypothetical protein M3Z06_14955 [Actinomycetota bacterium]|nr:hypothetical protein [Actinomycetota bacterium]